MGYILGQYRLDSLMLGYYLCKRQCERRTSKVQSISGDSLLSVLVIGLFILSCISQICNALAVSPSFLRETWIDDKVSGNIDQEPYLRRNYGHLPIDVVSSSFTSNGRFLNATLWLDNPIYEDRHSEYLDSNVTFMMTLSAEHTIADYLVTISPGPNNTWTKALYEFEPIRRGFDRTLKPVATEYNYTDFFVDGNRYVKLDLDLNSIGLPSSYWVSFRTSANKDGLDLNDRIYNQAVPPRLNRYIFNWPEDLRIRAGEEFVGKLSINSTQLQIAQTFTPRDANETDGIRVRFSPPSLQIPTDGITTADLIIQTSPELPVANYSIPIRGDVLTAQGVTTNLSQSFTAQIVPPSSQLEKLSTSLSRYSFYLSFIPIIATSIIAISLSRVIKTKSSVFENLSMTEIITIDASVIVGVLFFLTLGGSEVSSGGNLYMGILTASIVYPFALSAIWAVVKGAAEYGIRFMLSGFIYLMISIGLIAFLR